MFKNRLHLHHQQEIAMCHRRVMMIRIIRILLRRVIYNQRDHRRNRIAIRVILIQAKMNQKISAL